VKSILDLICVLSLVDDPQQAAANEDEGWEFVNLGDQQKFGIKTAGLEDKSTACQMLVHYARELKDGFVEYTEQVYSIIYLEHFLMFVIMLTPNSYHTF